MYDIWNNRVHMPFFPVITNNAILNHFTRTNINLHIDNISVIDKRNFLYDSVRIWNKCPVEFRTLPKRKFMQQCKLFLFLNVST